MTEIKFEQTSPRGVATLDVSRVLVDTDGRVFTYTGPASDNRIVPIGAEALAALEAHGGTAWRDALAALQEF